MNHCSRGMYNLTNVDSNLTPMIESYGSVLSLPYWIVAQPALIGEASLPENSPLVPFQCRTREKTGIARAPKALELQAVAFFCSSTTLER